MSIVFRTLKHEYRISGADDDAQRALTFMAIEPEIAGVPLLPIDLPIERRGGYLSIALPDGRTCEGTALHLLSRLHGLIWADICESEAGAPFVHCATVLGPWGRAILVGSKGTGKSTLALHLLSQGYGIEADEHLVVRETCVIARPRTLRIKAGALDQVPVLAERVGGCPSIRTWDGLPIYAVNPALGGHPWRIGAGRLDRLVFLDANHGGRSMISPLAATESLRRLTQQTVMPARGKAAAFGRLRQLVTTVPAFRLSLGDLPGAARELRALA